MRDFISRMGIVGELLQFLWMRKLYWLIPMIVTLIVFAVMIMLGNAGSPGFFIYTLF